MTWTVLEPPTSQAQPAPVPARTCSNDMTLWRIVAGFIKKNRGEFVLYVCCTLAIPLKDVLIPHLAGLLYKSVRQKRHPSLWPILASIFTVLLAIQVFNVGEDHLDHQLYPSMQQYVRDLMLSHQFAVKSSEYQDAEVGETVSLMYKLPAATYSYIDMWKKTIIPRVVALTVCTAYIAWILPAMGALLLAILAGCGALAYVMFGRCCATSTARDEQHTRIIRGVDDVLSNMRTVISFGKEADEIGLLAVEQAEYARLAQKTLHCSLVVKYVTTPLLILYVGALAYTCWARKVPEHQFVTLLIIAFIVAGSASELVDTYKEMIGKYGTISNSLSAFDACPKPRPPPPPPVDADTDADTDAGDPDPAACIRLSDVSYSYPGGRLIFEHLDLSFERGKATALVGEIGAGKSTLLSLLLGYQSPDAGHLFLDGVPYDAIDPAELRRRIFLLPQSPTLLNRSVYENVSYGLDREVSREEVQALIQDLGLGDFEAKVGGLDAPAGVRGSNLSGGQRQIVWLLKLLLSYAEVAVLDEPTASLDPETKATVARLVVRAMRDGGPTGMGARTVILSTHDAALVAEADVVVTL